MPAFLIPILIIIGIFAVTAGDELISGINLPIPDFRLFATSQDREESPSAVPPPSGISQAPFVPSPAFILDTVITQGPGEGSILSDSNVVTFEFEGSTVPSDTAGRVTFETRVQGVDQDWVRTSGRQRTITLPGGDSDYTFEVRSKLGTATDLTPATRAFSIKVSPSFGDVTVSFRRSTASQPFLATLTPRLGTGETLSVSGWTLQSTTGSFSLGYGTERVLALGTSFQDPITVKRGDRILVSGAASPFGAGGNFKPNICIGWLKEFYTFPLSVPGSCPDRLRLEDVSFLNPSCQDFLLQKVSFTKCEVPNYSQNTAVAGDSQCVSYINSNLTYNACVARHAQDATFLKNEWQVFANRSFGHLTRDTIRLLDGNGLLVDEYIY
ncbi:MAG: hypothetical protein Q8P12_03600 [bacterium]|nr:hypothetical protein [bacterium]